MPDDVPDHVTRTVVAFEEAKERLDSFMADKEIRELLEELSDLVSDHNRSLDEATRTVKNQLRSMEQRKLIIGPIGAQKKTKRWYDTEHLAEALPAVQSDLILTEKIEYVLDVSTLEQLLRQGEVDNEIVQQAYHEEDQQPSAMPGTPKAFTIPTLPVD